MNRALFLAVCASLTLTAHVSSQRADEMTVEGTLGSLPAGVVRTTVQSKHAEMTACFTARYEALPVLGGRIAFVLRVATDGSVRTVRLTESNVGDRATERCLARVGRGMRFQRPTGGEAEVRETFEVPPRPGMRPPTAWPETRVRSTVARAVEGLRRRCNVGPAPMTVTVIIGPGGRAIMSGASSSEDVSDAAYDCVTQAMSGLTYPNPGSYYAKTTLTL